ncbi:MAG: hypothetical protein V5B35_19615 [Candidatus Accumulibacter necessarius]
MTRLACWAGNFTSEICCLPPQTLLLEVAGSLRLFGGATALFERIVVAAVPSRVLLRKRQAGADAARCAVAGACRRP